MAQCSVVDPVYNIGRFGHCKLVTTPVVADITGQYRIEWTHKGGLFSLYVDGVAGNAITISASSFNEQSVNELTFYDPSGNVISQTLTASDNTQVEFSEFKLTVVPGFDASPGTGGGDEQTENAVIVVGNAAYSSDQDAASAGVEIGEYYEVGPAHDEGAIEGTIKKRIV